VSISGVLFLSVQNPDAVYSVYIDAGREYLVGGSSYSVKFPLEAFWRLAPNPFVGFQKSFSYLSVLSLEKKERTTQHRYILNKNFLLPFKGPLKIKSSAMVYCMNNKIIYGCTFFSWS